VFTSLFTLEMVLKIVAMGFVQWPTSYLRDYWNQLDCLVVLLSYLNFLPGFNNLSAIKAVRVLRPLKAIRSIPGIRIIVTALLSSLPHLGNVLLLFMFLLLIFGVLGVQLYGGRLKQNCFDGLTGKQLVESSLRLCSVSIGVGRTCPVSGLTTNTSFCGKSMENPNFSVTSFDNILVSFITMFQVVTLEGWTDVMYMINDIGTKWNQLYFVALVLFGSFFLVNLITAVVFLRFDQLKRLEEVKKMESAFDGAMADEVQHLEEGSRPSLSLVDNRASLVERVASEMGVEKRHSKSQKDYFIPGQECNEPDTVRRLSQALVRPTSSQPDPSGRQEGQQRRRRSIVGARLGEADRLKKIKDEEKQTERREKRKSMLEQVGQAKRNLTTDKVSKPQKNVVVLGKKGKSQNDEADAAELEPLDPAGSRKHDLTGNQDQVRGSILAKSTYHSAQAEAERRKNQSPQLLENRFSVQLGRSSLQAATRQKSMVVTNAEGGSFVNATDFRRSRLKAFESFRISESEYRPRTSMMEDSETHQASSWNIWAFDIVMHPRFAQLIVAAIVLNTVVLAMDHHGISYEMNLFIEISSYVLLAIFTLEMLLKWVAVGFCGYWKDKFNCFDALVVTISYAEIATGGSGLSVFRSLRLLRALKLLTTSPSLRALIRTVSKSAKDLYYFGLITMIFIFIFAVLGMQLFLGKFENADGTVPRANYDSFAWSIVTVFQIMTGENWHEIMYHGVKSNGWAASLYYIGAYIVGNFVLMSLFLAIMLGHFDSLEVMQVEEGAGTTSLLGKVMSWCRGQFNKIKCCKDMEDRISDSIRTPQRGSVNFSRDADKRLVAANSSDQTHHSSDQTHPSSGRGRGHRSVVMMERKKDLDIKFSKHAIVNQNEEQQIVIYGQSFGLFGVENKLRLLCVRIVHSHVFENAIVLLILVSSVCLALDEPNISTSNPTFYNNLQAVDYVVNSCFIVEALLKVLAQGFVGHPEAYLHSGWNRLDFGLVILSIVNMVVINSTDAKSAAGDATETVNSLQTLRALRVFRGLRALRALRMVSHLASLRLVLRSVLGTLSCLGNVFMIGSLFFTIFAILGVQLFKGKLMFCAHSVTGKVLYSTGRAACLASGHRWDNAKSNFDNFGNALLALFEIASLEAWPNIMHTVVDASTDGAILHHQPAAVLYFVAFIIVGSFFIIGLFVGVLVDEYNKQIEKFTGALDLTDNQRYYLQAYKNMLYYGPPKLNQPIANSVFSCSKESSIQQFANKTDPIAQVDRTRLPAATNLPAANRADSKSSIITRNNTVQSQGDAKDKPVVPPLNLEQLKEKMVSMTTIKVQLNPAAKLAGPLARMNTVTNMQGLASREKLSCEIAFRLKVFNVVQSKWFEVFIMTIITVNVLAMSLSYSGMDPTFSTVVSWLNDTCSVIFILELVLKVIGLGFFQYIVDRWNLFDACIVLISAVAFVLRIIGDDVGLDPSIFQAFRMLRVLRIFRLVRRLKGLKQLIQTLIFSFPMLFNVGTVLFLMLFMYSVVAMSTFGDISLSNSDHLNDYANFATFGSSLITLFRMSTGESWNGIMHDCMRTTNCIVGKTCGNPWVAVPFFCSFIVFSTFLMLNVFVAVVLRNFEEEVTNDPKNSTNPISRTELANFGKLWSIFTGGRHQLHCGDLRDFMIQLYPPLGPHLALLRPGPFIALLDKLAIPQFHGSVHWIDVCIALTSFHLFPDNAGCDSLIPDDNGMLSSIKIQVMQLFPSLKRTRRFKVGCAEVCAAMALQKHWRMKMFLRKFPTARDSTRPSYMHLPGAKSARQNQSGSHYLPK